MQSLNCSDDKFCKSCSDLWLWVAIQHHWLRAGKPEAIDPWAKERDKPAHRRLIRRCAAAIEPRPVVWLWRNRIARRAFNLVDGDPGEGKSWMLLDLAARISRGWKLPPDDGPGGKPANVLLANDEDDAASTIVPRLLDAGADMSRIEIIDGVRIGDEDMPLTLPAHLDLLEQAALETGAVMIGIDPLMSYLGGDVDSHKDHDVRRCLRQIKGVAERTEAAVVAIRHLNKMVTVNAAIYRGGGSIGIIGAARSALIVGSHPEDDSKRVIARTKGNLAADPEALVYSIEPETESRGPVIQWHGAIDLTADDLVSRVKERQTDERAAKKAKGDTGKVCQLLDELDPRQEGVKLADLKARLPWGRDRLERACTSLIDDGTHQWSDHDYTSGKGTTKVARGIRRIGGLAS
ncbi:MAG: AAA family ATPase [Gemmataceae bacterium]